MTTANGILDTPAIAEILATGSTAEKKAVADALPVREKLTAFRQYEVYSGAAPGGNGLTFGTAFQTRQQAVDYIRKNVDGGGFNIQIRCTGAMTDTVVVDGPITGCPLLIFLGDAATPANVTVTKASGHCFDFKNGAKVQVSGFKLGTTGSGNCINASTGAWFYALNTEYGACAGAHINVDGAGTEALLASRTISGGAVSHLHTPNGGVIKDNNNVVTIPSALTFSAYYAGQSDGTIEAIGTTYVGAGIAGTAGVKAFGHYNSTLRTDTGNRNLLPGDKPMVIMKGGRFDFIERMTITLTPSSGAGLTLTLNDSNRIFLLDSTAGDFTVNLPPVAGSDGIDLWFLKLVAANTVTLDGNASETINGATTRAMSAQWTAVKVHSDGTQWYEI